MSDKEIAVQITVAAIQNGLITKTISGANGADDTERIKKKAIQTVEFYKTVLSELIRSDSEALSSLS